MTNNQEFLEKFSELSEEGRQMAAEFVSDRLKAESQSEAEVAESRAKKEKFDRIRGEVKAKTEKEMVTRGKAEKFFNRGQTERNTPAGLREALGK